MRWVPFHPPSRGWTMHKKWKFMDHHINWLIPCTILIALQSLQLQFRRKCALFLIESGSIHQEAKWHEIEGNFEAVQADSVPRGLNGYHDFSSPHEWHLKVLADLASRVNKWFRPSGFLEPTPFDCTGLSGGPFKLTFSQTTTTACAPCACSGCQASLFEMPVAGQTAWLHKYTFSKAAEKNEVLHSASNSVITSSKMDTGIERSDLALYTFVVPDSSGSETTTAL